MAASVILMGLTAGAVLAIEHLRGGARATF
jgi:hypothetical protein